LSNVIRLIFIAIGFIGSTIATCAQKDETVLRRDSNGRIVLVKCALISSFSHFLADIKMGCSFLVRTRY
jgi:hypothetical protein